MEPGIASTPPPGSGSREIAVVLLVVQGSFALLAALSTLLLGLATGTLGVLAVSGLPALLSPLLFLALTVGVARRRRWAVVGVVIVEGVVLVTLALSLLLDLLPAVQTETGPLVLVTNGVLPAAAIAFACASAPAAPPRRARAAPPAPIPHAEGGTGGWPAAPAGGTGALPLVTRAAAALLAVTGVVHLAAAAEHGEAGWAFVLAGIASSALAVAALANVRGWRPAAVALLAGLLLAYVLAIGSRSEEPDQAALATKLVELTALGLVLVPRGPVERRWRRRLGWVGAAASVLFLGVLTGTVVWGVTLDESARVTELEREDRPLLATHTHRHGMPVPGAVHRHTVAGRPTPVQIAAAAQLADATRAGIARYQDPAVAGAAGYRPVPITDGTLAHWQNDAFMKDGRVLDPERPEQLVYANTAMGPVLVGAVYVMERPGIAAPRVGGPLTEWHTHSLCITPLPPFVAGLVTPFGTCPPGSMGLVTPEMMHVWTVANPGGPFAQKLDAATVARITGR
jgi:hypothetical protein